MIPLRNEEEKEPIQPIAEDVHVIEEPIPEIVEYPQIEHALENVE
jgi:hypothetical protein